VHSQASPCGICGEKGANGTGFPHISLFSSANAMPLLLHIHFCVIYRLNTGTVSNHNSVVTQPPPSPPQIDGIRDYNSSRKVLNSGNLQTVGCNQHRMGVTLKYCNEQSSVNGIWF
jgi:hypothetical protein